MKKQKQGAPGPSPPPTASYANLGRCPSVVRTVQSEGLNHPTDNPAFGRRIGTQSFPIAIWMSQQAQEARRQHQICEAAGSSPDS